MCHYCLWTRTRQKNREKLVLIFFQVRNFFRFQIKKVFDYFICLKSLKNREIESFLLLSVLIFFSFSRCHTFHVAKNNFYIFVYQKAIIKIIHNSKFSNYLQRKYNETICLELREKICQSFIEECSVNVVLITKLWMKQYSYCFILIARADYGDILKLEPERVRKHGLLGDQ